MVDPEALPPRARQPLNGFTVLVNGGSNPKSSFWKLVRHLDRVDAVLVTHAGADSLPGLNSLLRRKLAEREAAAGPQGQHEERLRRLLSPALGVVFLNAREAASRLRGGEDEAVCARSLLRSLGIAPLPLQRGPQPSCPTVLFEKLGVGRLELFVLHPPPGDPAAPACALLVWQPAAPGDKVVRVLFPGRTPPARLLDGLQRLQHLPCLRRPVVTTHDLEAPSRANSQDSLASRDSARKEPVRGTVGSIANRSTVRREPALATRDQKKDTRSGPTQPTARDTRRSGPGVVNTKPRVSQNGPRAPVLAAPLTAPVAECPGEAENILESERLSLSPLRPEPAPDASPSATTPTLTTPSLPAELGSPHSTEVDESLSVSFEQVLPAGDPGLSLPLRLARRSTSPHDVDLCLVSPCEFSHRKPPPPASPGSSDSSARSQERPPETPPTSVSESLPTLSDSDPVPVADSDDDAGSESAARDPPPTPRVPPPLPDVPGICMVDPEALPPRARQPLNGFTVLVNGGSNPKSSFWKLVRHLDRVDAVLVTHAGADSLPGLNSLLRRKLAEREAAAGPQGQHEERLRRLLSPALGVVFLNAREAASRLRGGEDEAVCARSLLRSLGIAPLPLQRGPQPSCPTVLFEKLGVGRLELFVLHPPPGDPAAPACALLVWQPAAPGDKVVRVLFPGRTPPARLLDGLQRLQHLPCLRRPVVTTHDLEAPSRANSQDSLASRDSARKEPVRGTVGSIANRSTVRREPALATRDQKKDTRSGPTQPTARDTRRSGPGVVNTKPRVSQNGPRAPVLAAPLTAPVAECPGEAENILESERPPAPSPTLSPAQSPVAMCSRVAWETPPSSLSTALQCCGSMCKARSRA